MAIALKGTPIFSTITADGSGNASLDITALGLSSGDCLLVGYNRATSSSDLSAPTATLNSSGVMTADTDLYSNDTRDVNSATYSKILTGADTSVAFSGLVASAVAEVVAFAYTGVSTPLDVAVTTATGIDTDAANAPSITPTTAGAKIVAFMFGVQGTVTAWTSPGNLSNFAQGVVGGGGTSHARIAIGDASWTSGAFDPAIVTGAEGSTSDSWTAVTYALRPTGGTAYTLTASVGSFTLTGVSATLKVGRKLTAAVGSFALSGATAALKVGRKLTAALGSFTLSGQAAALSVGRKLTASAGSYALTGSAVNLNRGIRLTAASGSYTLTGSAASLKRGFVLSANSATFALSGSAASLKIGRLLTAGSGAFVVSGSDAALIYTTSASFTLTAQPGVFLLNGSDATLIGPASVSRRTVHHTALANYSRSASSRFARPSNISRGTR